MNPARIFAVGGTVAVLAAVLVGLYISGSPKEQRNLRFDRERVQKLRHVSRVISNHWERVETLPNDLPELVDGIRLQALPTDPQTSKPYEYEKLNENSYRLCAVFVRSSVDQTPTDFWSHQSGNQCFEFTLEKEK